MNPGQATTGGSTTRASTLAAELTAAVYSVALRHGTGESWLDLELGLWKAVTDKNNYFSKEVFRGVVRNGKVSAAERPKLYEERMKRMPELDAAVREVLVMRPYEVEIVAAAP